MSDFWLGWVLCWCFGQGVQDYMGEEKYLLLAKASWVNTPWGLWIFVAFVALYLNFVNDIKER